MPINPEDLARTLAKKITEGGYTVVGDGSFDVVTIPGSKNLNSPADGFFRTASAGTLGVKLVEITEEVPSVVLKINRPMLFTFERRYWIAIPRDTDTCDVYGIVAFPDHVFAATPKYLRDIVYPVVKPVPVVVTNTVIMSAR